MSILVTGAAGFIGSNLVRYLRRRWPDRAIVSFDALTYAGNVENLAALRDDANHVLVEGDVRDREALAAALRAHQVDGIFHLAAESHVDRSLLDPLEFVQTNVLGTATLLLEAARYWGERRDVRFVQVSTDEVFGALAAADPPFGETTSYAPRSPYAATKAGADHLARAWMVSYGLPVIVTHCGNNYGPYQLPEKLIPLAITRALAGEPVPLYGQGEHVREWLFVEDHCAALGRVYEAGEPGQSYCIGGDAELTNLELVGRVLDLVDAERGAEVGDSRRLIRFVSDRPGHDFRYALDGRRTRSALGWSPAVGLEEGLARTVRWYLDNQAWCEAARGVEHERFEAAWYGPRLFGEDR